MHLKFLNLLFLLALAFLVSCNGAGGGGAGNTDSKVSGPSNSNNIFSNVVGLSDKEDNLSDIFIDGSGNVHVVGTRKMDPSGYLTREIYNNSGELIRKYELLVSNISLSTSLMTGKYGSIDAEGNLFINLGSTVFAAGLKKIDPSGNLTDVFPFLTDRAIERKFSGGYVYLSSCGLPCYGYDVSFINSTGIVSYPDGNSFLLSQTSNEIELDLNQNIFIVGQTPNGIRGIDMVGVSDAFIVKFSDIGILQWVKQYGVPGLTSDARDIVTDKLGNSYVLIYRDDHRGVLVKYSQDGTKVWTRELLEEVTDLDIAVDASDNLYVGSSNNVNNAFVTKFNGFGDIIFRRAIVNSSGISNLRIAVNSNGLIYAVGKSIFGSNDAFLTSKFNLENAAGSLFSESGLLEISRSDSKVTVDEDTPSKIKFLVSDNHSYFRECSAVVTATSDNQALLANSDIVITGLAPNCEASIASKLNGNGLANITFTAQAGLLSSVKNIELKVLPINDAPVISPIGSQRLIENGKIENLAFSVEDNDSVLGTDCSAVVTKNSSNLDLISNEGMTISGTIPNCFLSLNPLLNKHGSSNIELTVTDGEISVSTTVYLEVTIDKFLTSSNGDVIAKSIVGNTDGSIMYVIGETSGDLDGQINPVAPALAVFITKYTQEGEKLWTKILASDSGDTTPSKAAIRGDGVCFTGTTSGSLPGKVKTGLTDIFFVCYESDGTIGQTYQIGSPGKTSSGEGLLLSSSNGTFSGVTLIGTTDGPIAGSALVGAQSAFIISLDSNLQIISKKMLGRSGLATKGLSITSYGGTIVAGLTSNGNLNPLQSIGVVTDQGFIGFVSSTPMFYPTCSSPTAISSTYVLNSVQSGVLVSCGRDDLNYYYGATWFHKDFTFDYNYPRSSIQKQSYGNNHSVLIDARDPSNDMYFTTGSMKLDSITMSAFFLICASNYCMESWNYGNSFNYGTDTYSKSIFSTRLFGKNRIFVTGIKRGQSGSWESFIKRIDI